MNSTLVYFFPGCDWRQSKWSGSKCSYGHFDRFQICIYTRFVHTIQSSIFIFHRGKIHQNDFICRKSWKSQLSATIKIDFTKPCTVENPVQSASYRSMPWLVLGLVRSFLFCPGKSGFVVGGSKTQIYRLNRLHRLRIFLRIADHQSVFYFLRKHRVKCNKTQTGRVLLNGNS